ncbi:hypothetical protein [Rhizobium giardinii]|jgi:hypothetical protein|uniref:Uncharacterized protein n=1 Tax=Rhizobium giardinii TaxID=56731 RepID=A0A7W8UFE3_9HYPH|nr:hypothetical protein [Rhizobium giardinii]
MDLVGRKLPMENGDVARSFFALVRDELAATAGPAELVAVKTAVDHALAAWKN